MGLIHRKIVMEPQLEGRFCKPQLTFRDRFWRWFGFRSVVVYLPDGIEATHPGWLITETKMHFSFADRLRLLVCGRLNLTLRQATTQQVDEVVSVMSHRIVEPGAD